MLLHLTVKTNIMLLSLRTVQLHISNKHITNWQPSVQTSTEYLENLSIECSTTFASSSAASAASFPSSGAIRYTAFEWHAVIMNRSIQLRSEH